MITLVVHFEGDEVRPRPEVTVSGGAPSEIANLRRIIDGFNAPQPWLGKAIRQAANEKLPGKFED